MHVTIEILVPLAGGVAALLPFVGVLTPGAGANQTTAYAIISHFTTADLSSAVLNSSEQ